MSESTTVTCCTASHRCTYACIDSACWGLRGHHPHHREPCDSTVEDGEGTTYECALPANHAGRHVDETVFARVVWE